MTVMTGSSTGVGETAKKRGAGLPDDEACADEDDDDDIYTGNGGLSPVA